MARATGKEAIRLWFEFLKRALAGGEFKVRAKHYQAWGDVKNTTFEAWWKAYGEALFPLRKVQLVQRRLSDSGMVTLAVPMSITPTEAGNQVRDLLMQHYQAIKHQPLNRPGICRHFLASNLRPNRRCHEAQEISRRI